MPRIAFRNFTGGEVTPRLSARYDLQKFGTFLQCCENFIPNVHGDIERRPGMAFVGELGGESVLLPFQFNTEPENNYVLIFQKGLIRVASANGLLADVGMESPYELTDICQLSVAQVGDVLYLANKKYPLHKIMRSGDAPDYAWELKEVKMNVSLSPPGMPVAEWHRGPKSTNDDAPYTQNETSVLRYKVTAVDSEGVESLPSPAAEVTARYPTDWVVGDFVSLTWKSVEGADTYNVYRESAGYYGLIGVVEAAEGDGGTVTALKAGSVEGTLVHFGGYIEHYDYWASSWFVDEGAGYGYKIKVSKLKVTANEKENAFILNDRDLFLRVKKEYFKDDLKKVPMVDESGEPVVDDEGNQKTQTVIEKKKKKTKTFWVYLPDINPEELAREYEDGEWEMGEKAEEGSTPRGAYGPYYLEPTLNGTMTLSFNDQNFEPDTATTPKEDWNPFANKNYPATVCFHQQRMVLGGTKDNPASFYMSRTGDYENFRKSRPLQDDDPVEYMLASGSIDDIKWMVSFGDLLIGTSGAEYQATSSGAAITHSDIQINVQSYWGSASILPLIIGNSVVHCQRSDSHARDLYYSWESDGYSGNDLSLLASHLVESHRIVQWAYQQSPGSVVWAVRDDGTLLCLTYMKEQNVYGWSRHVTQGKVRSVAVISGEREDVVMLVVEREIGEEKKFCLERLTERLKDADPIEDAFYLDCGAIFQANRPTTEIGGLEHLEGAEVTALADGTPVPGLTVRDGQITLPFPVRKAVVGFGYASVMSPLPVETDVQGGSTLGKRRAYGKCVLRMFRTVGGKYAATRWGDLYMQGAWQEREAYDIPSLPYQYGQPCQPFSGDVEITLPSGQDTDTSIWLMQDMPLPMRVTAIMTDIDFGEE